MKMIEDVAALLKADARLSAALIVDADGRIDITGQGAHVVAVSCDTLGDNPEVLEQVAEGSIGLLLLGRAPSGLSQRLRAGVAIALVEDPRNVDTLFLAVDSLLERVELKQSAAGRTKLVSRYRYELSELIEIARAITQERDLNRLLGLVLEKSRFITGADAGSIYVIEGDSPDITKRSLRFKLSQNDSLDFKSSEFVIPVSNRSIAGASVIGRKPINIADVYHLDPNASYTFDGSFDRRMGYRTRSVLVMPMISAQDEVIGVIQLINKKQHPESRLSSADHFEDEVVLFDPRSEELLATLAAQAGIALENALLYDEIRRIFEGFVRASVQAIEQRDPTTSGHSLRVSVLSTTLAKAVDRADAGVYKDAQFSRRDIQELEYASLLHDFGKIGVREHVLIKAKKLYPEQLTAIRARMDYALKASEVDALQRKITLIREGASSAEIAHADEQFAHRRNELEQAWKVIASANEPTVLAEGDFSRIAEMGSITYPTLDGELRTLLTAQEVLALQVTRGSLTESEIDEIRSHVVHTYNFLARIPWGKSMMHVAKIAGAHHERLNGRGYPHGMLADEIPLQSKIMSIADIYDALTARDRPYKKALPAERALQILSFEVKDGHIDGDLVRIFQEAEVFKSTEGDLKY